MSGKMNPADLDLLLRAVGTYCSRQEEKHLRAHIAAVEAERDLLKEAAPIATEAWRIERDALRKKIEEHERAAAQAIQTLEARAQEAERLRERVKALEQGIRNLRECACWVPSVPRPAADTLGEVRASVVRKADELLFPEVCPAPSTVQGAHKPGTNPDALHCCGTTTDEHREGCPHAQVIAAIAVSVSPEPSTAEAFAAVRAELREGYEAGEHAPGEAALSLLEGRMGAQVGVIQSVLRLHERGLVGGHHEDVFRELRLAITTDAPPVFTLAEVETTEKRLRDEVPNPGEQYLSGWLDALDTYRQALLRLRR